MVQYSKQKPSWAQTQTCVVASVTISLLSLHQKLEALVSFMHVCCSPIFPLLLVTCFILDTKVICLQVDPNQLLLLHLCKLRAYNIIIYTTTVNQVCNNLLEQMPNSVCFCWGTVASFCFCPSGQILSKSAVKAQFFQLNYVDVCWKCGS